MMIKWPCPQPQTLRYISPSLASEFVACQLKAAFSRDPHYRYLRRPSENAIAGVIAHAVYERVAKHDYCFPVGRDPESVLSKLWDEEVARASERFQRSWAPAIVPSPERWPNMARTRRTLIRSQVGRVVPGDRRVPTKADREQATRERASDRSPGSLPWVEQRLIDDETGIEGTPDRVERQEEGVWVLDLKSGWDQVEATTSQKQQLLVYAHLVDRKLGERPIRAAIDARRGRFSIRIDWDEVATEVRRLRKLRTEFNNGASSSSGVGWLARPAAETCRFCPYRPVCRASQAAVDHAWRLPLVVTGAVVSVEAIDDRVAVDLKVAYPSWLASTDMRIVDVVWRHPPAVGDLVSVSRVHLSSDMGTLTGAWNSLTAHLSQAD